MTSGAESRGILGIGYGVLAGATVLTVLTLRLVTDGNARLQEADRALEKGDRRAAIVALEDAAKAYVPGGLHVPRALKELSVLARAAEMRGDDETALKAWETVRRSILATRHFYQPNEDTLEAAERSIVRIRLKEPLDVSPETLVQRPTDPSAVLSVLLFVGLGTWIGGAALWALRPRRRSGEYLISVQTAIFVCLGGLALWLISVWWI